MGVNELICITMIIVVAFVVLWMGQRWVVSRMAKRWVDTILTAPRSKIEQPQLLPESRYVVETSGTRVRCTAPDGTIESVEWADLRKVEIVTTDEGPFLPDVFWVLHGTGGGCVIPQGATGEGPLLDRLQALPGFRNEVIVQAMSLTASNRLVCWEYTPSDSGAEPLHDRPTGDI